VWDEIARLQKEGIDATYLDKIKEQKRRAFETDTQRNDWWQGQLDEAYDYGDDPRKIVDISHVLARIDSDHVKHAARKFLDKHKYVSGTLLPVEAAPAAPVAPEAPATTTPPPASAPTGDDGLN
jgi:hypothetical protein